MPHPGEQYGQIQNPFVQPPIKISEYTETQILHIQDSLDKHLGPEFLSTRPGPGGLQLTYISAEKVISLANEIFGFNGWSSQICNTTINYITETNGRIGMSCSVICRVILKDGTFHEDTGSGHIENCPSKAQAFEKVQKEATTDALKRALRNFGNVLGNCIYDKDYLSQVRKVPRRTRRWNEENYHRHPMYDCPPKVIQNQNETHISKINSSTSIKPVVHQNISTSTKTPDNVIKKPIIPTTTSVLHCEPLCPVDDIDNDDDEYGYGDDDGMDFINPDEVCLDSPTKSNPSITYNQNNAALSVSSKRNLSAQAPSLRPSERQSEVQKSDTQQKSVQPQTNNTITTPVSRVITITDVPQRKIESLEQSVVAEEPNEPTIIWAKPPENPNALGWTNPKGLLNRKDVESDTYHSNIPFTVIEKKGEPSKPTPSKRTEAANAAQNVQGSQNFVNPQATAARKIGMPGRPNSPMTNRSAYKPPGPATGKRSAETMSRPALSDVSNAYNGRNMETPVKKVKSEEVSKLAVDSPSVKIDLNKEVI